MLGPLIAFASGVVASLLSGGRLDRLGEARFRRLPLFWLSLVAPLVIAFGPGRERVLAAAVGLVVVSNLLLVAFALSNRHVPGLALVALGVFLNALVIALNGGMPVSAAGREQASAVSVGSIKHEPLGDETLLPWLADRVPVGVTNQVWSLGDLLLVAGVGMMGFGLPRRDTSTVLERGRKKTSSAPA